MKKRCPSCYSDHFKVVDSVPVFTVIDGYRQKHLDIDISSLMQSHGDRIDLLECSKCELRWFWPMVAGDADFYEQLQRHDWYYQTDKPEHLFAATHILPGKSVCEIGCGAGAFASRLYGSSIYRGLEFNKAAVTRAVASGLNVVQQSVEAEAASHPGAYDVVCHFQVLEHVTDVCSFMRACVATLRPDGLMIVAVPSEDSFLSIAGASWLNMPPHHVSRWTDRALANLFTSLGLQTVEIWHEPVASYHADWYSTVLAERGVRSLVGSQPNLAGGQLASKLAYRLTKWPLLRHWLVARGESGFEFKKRGHSVCVVGRPLLG